MSILNWISSLVKNAVLRGFAEAVQELELEQDHTEGALAALKDRMAPALASPEALSDCTKQARSGKSK